VVVGRFFAVFLFYRFQVGHLESEIKLHHACYSGNYLVKIIEHVIHVFCIFSVL